VEDRVLLADSSLTEQQDRCVGGRGAAALAGSAPASPECADHRRVGIRKNNAASATRSDDAVEGRMRNGLDAIQADSAQVEAAATALQG